MERLEKEARLKGDNGSGGLKVQYFNKICSIVPFLAINYISIFLVANVLNEVGKCCQRRNILQINFSKCEKNP